MFRIVIEGYHNSTDFPDGIIGAEAKLCFCLNEEMGGWDEELEGVRILKIEKVEPKDKEGK